MKKICFLFLTAVLLTSMGLAQDVPSGEPAKVVVVPKGAAALNAEPGTMLVFSKEPGQDNAVYLREMISGGEAIKGAPYTATALTESTQVLGDGNRIVRKSSAFVARDGQGRTRREESFGEVGGLSVESGKMYFISDPTTGTDYILNPGQQVARVVKREGLHREEPPAGAVRKKLMQEKMQQGSGENATEFKHESLGTQVIEGVNCDGIRETKVIPAGAIGNERPLEITSESWTSQDLHVLVLRKRNDPRLGETVYKLTNIKLGEPDASLFQLPSGYKTLTVVEPRPSKE